MVAIGLILLFLFKSFGLALSFYLGLRFIVMSSPSDPVIVALEKAEKEIFLAGHLLYVSFEMVKDPKFFVAVFGHIIDSAKLAVGAILGFERMNRRIPPYPSDFQSQVRVLMDIGEGIGISEKNIKLLGDLSKIKYHGDEGVINFRRGDRYILATSDYSMETLDRERLKSFLHETKDFILSVRGRISGKKQAW